MQTDVSFSLIELFLFSFLLPYFLSLIFESDLARLLRKENIILRRVKGVFRLCAGDDRLDVVFIGRVDARFCRIFRRWSGLNTVDDHGRTIFARTAPGRHVNIRTRQLGVEFRRWYRLPNVECKLSSKHIIPLKNHNDKITTISKRASSLSTSSTRFSSLISDCLRKLYVSTV